MNTSVLSAKGWVVIPRELRERYGLEKGENWPPASFQNRPALDCAASLLEVYIVPLVLGTSPPRRSSILVALSSAFASALNSASTL
jgi:hypothetical protein